MNSEVKQNPTHHQELGTYDAFSLERIDQLVEELINFALSKMKLDIENPQLSIPLTMFITYQENNSVMHTVVKIELRLTNDRSRYVYPNNISEIIANHFPDGELGEIQVALFSEKIPNLLIARYLGDREEISKCQANSDAKNTLGFEPWEQGVVPINIDNTRTPFEKVYSDIYTVMVNCISRYLEASTFPKNKVFRVELFQNGAVSKILDFNVGCITRGLRKKTISDVVIYADTKQLRGRIRDYWLKNQDSSSSVASILVRVVPNPNFE